MENLDSDRPAVRGVADRLSQVAHLADQASEQTTQGRRVVNNAVRGSKTSPARRRNPPW